MIIYRSCLALSAASAQALGLGLPMYRYGLSGLWDALHLTINIYIFSIYSPSLILGLNFYILSSSFIK